MKHTALTPEEYQHWKDTALLDRDWTDRFAATIDHLFAVNAQLLEALEALEWPDVADDGATRMCGLCGALESDEEGHSTSETFTYPFIKARAALEEARK